MSKLDVTSPPVFSSRWLGAFLGLMGWLAFSAPASSAGTRFAGVPVVPGGTVRANVPLSDVEKSYVSEGGNAVPSHTVAVLGVPRGFDPSKTWPVLVVFSTSDFKLQNRDDLAHLYGPTAMAEGWVVIAGDGPEPAPRLDSSGWRAGHTLAALDALNRSFPASKKWPLACAGYSGGAKRAGLLAPLLAVAGYHISGIFLTGINVDTITEGYRKFKPGSNYQLTPIFLSTGVRDTVATPAQQTEVKNSMQRAGFGNIQQKTFPYGHVVKKTHIEEALRWFRGK
ncbi:MAG: hypothetical protein ABI946_08530 [Chthoniobacterales bacterium]